MVRKDVLQDYLDRLLEAVRDHQEGFSESVAVQIEKQVRAEWAGERAYIAKTPYREKRRLDAHLDLMQGDSVREVMLRHGMGRSTVYALFHRKK